MIINQSNIVWKRPLEISGSTPAESRPKLEQLLKALSSSVLKIYKIFKNFSGSLFQCLIYCDKNFSEYLTEISHVALIGSHSIFVHLQEESSSAFYIPYQKVSECHSKFPRKPSLLEINKLSHLSTMSCIPASISP